MEILACPHCERLFQTTPKVLGKNIRCRGCGGLFHIPKDTSSVPLGPPSRLSEADVEDRGPPVAIACLVDGQEARRCPICSRTFSMKPSFIGKVIRCRGCKVSFRVAATEASAFESESYVTHEEADGKPSSAPPPSVGVESPVAIQPTVFEDIGDVLDNIITGEQAPSVVRPRNVPAQPSAAEVTVLNLVGMVAGTVTALPVTQLILWWGFRRDPLGIAAMLPEALRWIAPDQLGR